MRSPVSASAYQLNPGCREHNYKNSGGVKVHGQAKTGFAKWYIDVTVPIIFYNRVKTIAVLAIITLFLGWQASQLKLDAGFEKMLPLGHPYIQVFKQYQKEF
ncbi:MAG: hypothetical protein OSB38_23300, partial [Paraburkholderia fungorum]|nr:hypothetical protein [Paraburkholderia fungorum]